MNENEKVAHLVKGVSEEIYRAIVTFEIATTEEFIRWCRKIELSQKKRVNTRIVFDRLPNAAAINLAESESMEDLIRRIVREEIHHALNPDPATLKPSSLDLIIREEVERNLSAISQPVQRPMPRQQYSNRPQIFKQTPRQQFLNQSTPAPNQTPPQRRTDEWRTHENVPICFHCGRPGHVARYCRDRSVFEEAKLALNKKITVINEDNRGGKDLMIEGSKDLILKKELVIPSSIINFHHGRGEIWVTNGTSQNQIIPAGMLVGYLKKIGSSGIYSVDTAENEKFQSNIKNEDRRQQILSLVDDRLNEEQKSMIAECQEKYSEVFDFERKSFSTTSNVKHKIDTSDSRPIKQRPYRVSPVERRAIQTEVDKMIKMGIVQPSESPWSSPVVLVKKKDGSWRFCVDYRKLNKVTKKYVYPLPRNDDVLDSLTGAKFFSSMDLRTGYWQIEIDEEDREKTAFITPDGLYEFRVMPFGLCNAPATFERMMDKLLAELKWTICLCYLDDIIVYATSFKEHIERLGKVLRCIQHAGLCINHEKCRFRSREIKVLGHLVTESGIRPDPDKIEAITNFSTPKPTTEVRSFMGLCSYYKRFMKYFANKAKPLHDLLRNNVKLFWSNDQEQSFQILKSALTTDPVLGHFKEDAETTCTYRREWIWRRSSVDPTDRGRTFISHTIQEINNLCGTAHRFTSAYQPQTNGLTERLNKTLGDMLSMYVDVDQRNWDSVLPYVTFAYNTAKQETTGFSPFYLVHGRDVETPLDTILTYREEANLDDYVESLVTNAEDARQLARLNILKAQEKDKFRYDKSHRPVQYRTEDLVWVYTPVRKQGLSEKLLKIYFGPYKVVRQLSENIVCNSTANLYRARRPNKVVLLLLLLINVINRETHIWITNPFPRPLKIMKNQTLAFGSSPAKINVNREREVEENEEPRFQINENLSPKEQMNLKQVLERYGYLFSSRLGRTNLAKHRIDTEDAKPIKHKPYRVSAKELDIIKEQIDEMLTEGIIRPSSSPWSFPVILVKKRDGKYRFCVDYRKLNNVTVKDIYPIPRIDEVMDTLQGSTYFSAIDLRSGYWQVEVEERDKEKTAFTTAHGLYEFNVMPFELCNAPATFERNMENMLGNLRWQICLCYLDDVVIYSPDFPTHLKRLEAVFRCFCESNLRLNDKKCRFAFEELEILGSITSKHGIKPAEHDIKAIRNFPRPKKVKEVQSFLGMCSYYRKIIKDFSKIVDPLTNLIKTSVSFTWTERQEEAFQTLKTALLSPPILGHFNPNAPTYVHTDASNIGIGATLVQNIGVEEK
ncbi:hypothetical protein LAZ67_9001871, partial [Cordylochernes scorpioides]